MARYRKVPVTIEAEMLTMQNMHTLAKWSGGRVVSQAKPSDRTDVNHRLLIPTLEGTMTAHLGDWVIRGVAGEFYPCRNDIFLKTYEAV